MDQLPTHFDRSPPRSQGASRGYGPRGRGRSGGGRSFRGGRGRRHHSPRQRAQGPGADGDRIEEMGSPTTSSVTIAVEGCCHGELDAIYERIRRHEEESGQTVDILLCCGDFQSIRNLADLHALAVPPKYRALGDFHAYYSGAKKAPVLTLFVGGNHESSQALLELPYGGWVAPNIYYMGWAGVVNFAGLRIGGISGIYAPYDYNKSHFEVPPFDRSTLRSVYHVRHVDVHRMLSLSAERQRLDVVLSHDWPLGVEQHGDTDELVRRKPFFRDEIQRNELGSPPNRLILNHLKPRFWFSAHLHVKFHATVNHAIEQARGQQDDTKTLLIPSQTIKPNMLQSKANDTAPTSEADPSKTIFIAAESSDPCQGPDLTEQMTQFLSLDKCLPRRTYLSIVHVPVKERPGKLELAYDLEWLAMLVKTHELTSLNSIPLPEQPTFVTSEEIESVRLRIGSSPTIPTDFVLTVPPHLGPARPLPHRLPPPLPRQGNPQTDQLLNVLGLPHVTTIPYGTFEAVATNELRDDNEIDLDDEKNENDSLEDGNEIDLDGNEDNDPAGSAETKRQRVGSA